MLQRLPAVTTFVRHRSKCPKAHHGEAHQNCTCAKWHRFFMHGKLHRRPAHTRSWEEAQNNAKELQERLTKGEEPTVTPDASNASRRTVRDEVQTYLAKKQGDNVGAARLRKLRHQLGLFVEFLEKRSRFYADDVTRDDVVKFRSTCWKDEDGTPWGDLTAVCAQSNLRGFVKFCCKANKQELLEALTGIKETKEGKARRQPRPFSDAEINKLLEQVPVTFKGNDKKIAVHQTLIRLLASTGLAIIDAVQLQKSALEKAKRTRVLEVVRQKTDRPARIPIDKSLLNELTLVLNGNPRYVFWSEEFLAESETKRLREEMCEVMTDAGLYIEGNVFHRFRDSVVDFWIEQGWSVDDIARALGDTIHIVQKHYESRLSERVQKRMADLPTRTWQ